MALPFHQTPNTSFDFVSSKIFYSFNIIEENRIKVNAFYGKVNNYGIHRQI
jgi:hypothetical protein